MKQAIAGVAPPELGEVTIMTVWPTMASTGLGRLIGRLCGVKSGVGRFFTLGKLFALMSIPVALPLYFYGVLPGICRRYTLTNRRLIIQKGLTAVDQRWVELDNFDRIEVQVLPGQEWFPAGELIFYKGAVETFRLSGVSRPETFKQTCLKAQRSFVGIKQALDRELAHA